MLGEVKGGWVISPKHHKTAQRCYSDARNDSACYRDNRAAKNVVDDLSVDYIGEHPSWD